jgi:leucyl aminopeptidase
MSAPPAPPLPRSPVVTQRTRLSERYTAGLDAVLVIVPHEADAALLGRMPHAVLWRGLHARAQRSGGIASAALPNAHGTWAVLGVLPRAASVFQTLALAGRLLKELTAHEIEAIALAAPAHKAGTAGDALDALLSAALAHAFELPSFRKPTRRKKLRRIELVGGGRIERSYIEAAASANNLARYLTALPANVLEARSFRRFIGAVARQHGLRMRWLDERALARLGANAFLAVAAGNAERTAGIAHLSYRPRRGRTTARGGRTPPRRAGSPDVALVGKGILFDTGGTNLKPHRAMLDMHTDMAGSAVALAVLAALARLNAPLRADAWLAITENRIGPTAYLPQDVVRAANGTTIQVIHTDAEGRMVLADTLALAGRTRPRLIVDFGTLTGACVYALTERMSGIFTNEPRLTEQLLAAGRSSGERVWSFPFEADYDSDLESKVADILQCAPEGKGDHILAARFLSRFVPEGTPWVHLDLSAAVRAGGLAHIHTDVTGFGVRYALELLLRGRVLHGLGALNRRQG